MNSTLERTWQSICHLKNTFIVQARVDESCTHFALLHAIRVFCVLPICTIRHNGSLVTPYDLLMSTKPKLQHLRVLFCPCVVKTYSTTKVSASGRVVTMDVVKNFAQRGVQGIYVGVDDLTNGHLVYLPQILQVVSSVDVIFDENILSALVYKNRSYREAILTRPILEHPIQAHNHEYTGDITNSIIPVLLLRRLRSKRST